MRIADIHVGSTTWTTPKNGHPLLTDIVTPLLDLAAADETIIGEGAALWRSV